MCTAAAKPVSYTIITDHTLSCSLTRSSQWFTSLLRVTLANWWTQELTRPEIVPDAWSTQDKQYHNWCVNTTTELTRPWPGLFSTKLKETSAQRQKSSVYRADSGDTVLGKGSPPHQLGGLEECCKLPQWGHGSWEGQPSSPARGSGGVL